MHSSRMRNSRFSGRLYRGGGDGGVGLWVTGVFTTPLSPHPCGQTNTSENITLPQTSFAGGKKLAISYISSSAFW